MKHTRLALGIATLTLALTGCAAAGSPAATTPPADLGHIHALATDSEDRVLVASHIGVFRLPDDATAPLDGPIGGAAFDAMSFAYADGAFFASGHPDATSPEAFGAPNLGLIRARSDDGPWENLSLTGTTDFHALAAAGKRVYGIDSAAGQLHRSDDGGRTWTSGAVLAARDLTIPSDEPNILYATTPSGITVSTDQGATFTLDSEAPALALLHASSDGVLVGVSPDNTLWRKTPDGWTSGGQPTGTARALTLTRTAVVVATDRGIESTTDLGATWTTVWMTGSE